jgi:hypothetical protein
MIGRYPYNRTSAIHADIDGDGLVNPLIDGLLILRGMLGLPESALASGIIVSPGATRTTPRQIANYLQTCGVSVTP